MDGELKHKFIFIDFYMQHCKWCYLITDDFNKLIEDTESWFGKEAMAFLKVDGQLVWQMAQRYQVMYFPHFVAIGPGKNGDELTHFKGADRNYQTLKQWVLEVMADVPLKTTDAKVLQEFEEKSIKKIH